jgi:hypothetical protein
LVFLDWLRGIAVLIILQGHTFHSFIRPEQRIHGFYLYSQFIGGQAAAVFLFLTGITFGLGVAKRADLAPPARLRAALRRARYLFVLAILFRLQMWLFSAGKSPWTDLLRVDVLNLMGATAALLSVIALASEPRQRFRWALLMGTLIAGLAPLVTALDLSSWPWYLRDYIQPGLAFSIFPWGSFMAFGAACGSVIRLVPQQAWGRVMQWTALVGFALVLLGLYCSQLTFSIYEKTDFWLDSPALIACKLGATLLMAAGAFLWTEYLNPGPSFVRLLGVTSLPVYWVHVELVYGNAAWALKEKLSAWECVVASLLLTLLMTAMAWAIHHYPWREWLRGRWAAWSRGTASLSPSGN